MADLAGRGLLRRLPGAAWGRAVSIFRAALARWLEADPPGVEALFAAPASSVADVGRQATYGAAILDTVAWLELNGWADVGRGDLQCYAAWLLERRAAYERQGAPT